MPDVVDAATRSRMMSAIRGKDTGPEMTIRKGLHRAGFRFRLHDKRLPGRPDVVFPARRAAVFVHGCYWHRHVGCSNATSPQTRVEFWAAKFEGNVARDARVQEALRGIGWRIGVVWECAVRNDPQRAIDELSAWLREGTGDLVVG